MVEVAGIQLHAPHNHIYNHSDLPPSYDKGPWSYISTHLCTPPEKTGLIDIGSNIGDSVAYFRQISSARAICVDASSDYCSILTQNMHALGEIVLMNALVAPTKHPSSPGQQSFYKFTSGGQTGMTQMTDNPQDAYEGEIVTVRELIDSTALPSIFKSDTDGFDSYILESLVEDIDETTSKRLPIVFVEGPSATQMQNNSPVIESYLDSIRELLSLGYNCTLFSNYGTLYSECGRSSKNVKSCFYGLRDSYEIGRPYCYYLDIILYLPY